MADTATAPPEHTSRGWAVGLAIGSVVLWFAVLSVLKPEPIADEAGQHLHAIRQFYLGDWTTPAHIPMLPSYHALAALCWKLSGPHLIVLRAMSALMAISAILACGAITKNRTRGPHSDAILHFAWLPILFPFLAMVYTEAMSMLFLVLAVLLHTRRRFALSALMLLFTCLVRQSNVVWVAFMAVWAVATLPSMNEAAEHEGPAQSRPLAIRTGAARVWGHALILAVAAGFFIYNRGAMPAAVEANRIRVNAAQFYLFALFVIVLWAPIWLSRFRGDVRALRQWTVARPMLAIALLVIAAGVVAALTAAYSNPHPWNGNVKYLRNVPLVAMSQSFGARIAVSCLIVVVVPVIVRFTMEQIETRMLALVWIFSLLFLLPHSLAEPRYYIVPAFLLNLFTHYTPQQSRRLVIWYLMVSVAIGAHICVNGSRVGGIW